jgi:hypothetical protein
MKKKSIPDLQTLYCVQVQTRASEMDKYGRYLLNPKLIPLMILKLCSGDFWGIAGFMSCLGSIGVVGLGIVPRRVGC